MPNTNTASLSASFFLDLAEPGDIQVQRDALRAEAATREEVHRREASAYLPATGRRVPRCPSLDQLDRRPLPRSAW